MENYMKLDFYSEFKNYAMNHMGISGMQMHYWETLQASLYNSVQVNASLTPYILEEREMRVTQMDIFSRLMMDRILWVAGPVNDQMSTVVSAQLMFLDNVEERDITMHVDSPGGSVKSGLSMVDVMNYVASDVNTINTGMAASMGSILLGNGEKGKRFSLPNSKVMLHQVSAGAQGHVEDMKISLEQAVKYNDNLFTMLGEYCGKTKAQVIKDCNRDNWLDADEALKYGIIDGIIESKSKGSK
jgi:ATP-dependent Clp protease protease subunit